MHAQPFFRIGHLFVGRIPFGRNNFWLTLCSGFARSEIYVVFYIALKSQLQTKFQTTVGVLPATPLILHWMELLIRNHAFVNVGLYQMSL